MPPPAASMAPPPTVTSAPLPSQPPPPPPPSAPPPPHHGGPGPRADEHVYKFDFVLTPKDPKDASLTPTMFSVSIGEHQTGEVMVGKNVPLVVGPPPPATDKNAPVHPLGVPRQDVGLKVRAHPESIEQTSDILIDVDLELSSMEGSGSIRKITSHGVVVATPGKSAQVMSLDDDKRHYDLAVTTTKVR